MIVIDKLNDTLTAAAEVVILALAIVGIAFTVADFRSELSAILKLNQKSVIAVAIPYAHSTAVITIIITANARACYGIDL